MQAAAFRATVAHSPPAPQAIESKQRREWRLVLSQPGAHLCYALSHSINCYGKCRILHAQAGAVLWQISQVRRTVSRRICRYPNLNDSESTCDISQNNPSLIQTAEQKYCVFYYEKL
jgi:hypothetical protein